MSAACSESGATGSGLSRCRICGCRRASGRARGARPLAVGRFVSRRLIERAWGHGSVHVKLLSELPAGSGTVAEARMAARYPARHVRRETDDGLRPAGLHRCEVAQAFSRSGSSATGSRPRTRSTAPHGCWDCRTRMRSPRASSRERTRSRAASSSGTRTGVTSPSRMTGASCNCLYRRAPPDGNARQHTSEAPGTPHGLAWASVPTPDSRGRRPRGGGRPRRATGPARPPARAPARGPARAGRGPRAGG
jgi:hypothetical protein